VICSLDLTLLTRVSLQDVYHSIYFLVFHAHGSRDLPCTFFISETNEYLGAILHVGKLPPPNLPLIYGQTCRFLRIRLLVCVNIWKKKSFVFRPLIKEKQNAHVYAQKFSGPAFDDSGFHAKIVSNAHILTPLRLEIHS